LKKAIFLDRDGVICENRHDYVKSWFEFQFLPDVKQSLATLCELPYPIIVVTNQSAIGRGLVSTEVIQDIHDRMVNEVVAYGGRIDRVFHCPHHPADGCDCRKPEPGLLRQAAREMGIDLNGSYLIGDATTDIVAGQRAGCQTLLVLTGRGQGQLTVALNATRKSFVIARDLLQAALCILAMEHQALKQPYYANHAALATSVVNLPATGPTIKKC
jgi:histidinol-phosphate phosphatase family protein